MQGSLIYKTDPVYPPIAKAAHVQGAVVLRAIISKTGTIEDLRAISGPEMLKGSAMDAVKQWTYKPYLLNGEPVEVETTITVNYTFGGDSAETQGQAPPADNAGITPKRIGGSVSAPIVVYQVNPEYSEQARAAKFSGVVLVNLWVDQNGNPTHVHVLRGVGMGLDEKAVEAVSQYKFKPAMQDGKPVMVELNIEVNFRIFDSPKAQSQPIDRSHMSSVRKTAGDGASAQV
jgi:TonB family protein